MRGVNRVFLVGNLGQAPELRVSRAGEAWCRFSLATNRRRRDEAGNWGEEADWHSVRVFGKAAESCMRFLGRGSTVAIEGSIRYDKWTDNEGNRRISTRILADRITFLSGTRSAEARGEVVEAEVAAEVEPVDDDAFEAPLPSPMDEMDENVAHA